MTTGNDNLEAENGAEMMVQKRDWERVAKEAEFRPARMAVLCSISERQLERVFKMHVNCTPSQWLRRLQCRLAKDLVEQGYSSKAAAAELTVNSTAASKLDWASRKTSAVK